jgi:hypothetical protein
MTNATNNESRILAAFSASKSYLDEGHVRLDFSNGREPLVMSRADYDAFLTNEEATRIF